MFFIVISPIMDTKKSNNTVNIAAAWSQGLIKIKKRQRRNSTKRQMTSWCPSLRRSTFSSQLISAAMWPRLADITSM